MGLPSFPVGEVTDIDFDTMSALVHIGETDVPITLERRTAGEGARKRASVSVNSSAFLPLSGLWEWCFSASGHGQWCAYHEQQAAKLEKAFQAYEPKVELTLDVASKYFVDLELMVQINCRTQYRRLVRRTPSVHGVTSGPSMVLP